MLTKSDIEALRQLIRTEVPVIIREEVPPLIDKAIQKKIIPEFMLLLEIIGEVKEELSTQIQELRNELNTRMTITEYRLSKLERV